MRLLITTQTLDRDDLVLGFFHEWIAGLAARFDAVDVVCLREGKHSLPANVHVHSLGKERGAANRAAYAFRFLRLSWRLRREYDRVFVHMNQEYLLLSGWLWKLLGKRAFLWRNHYEGSLLTDIVAAFAAKVFCTSKHSYTAKYAKTVLMPVGVDTDLFRPDPDMERVPRSILSFGRIAPSKQLETLIEALALCAERGDAFTAAIYGDALPEHAAYRAALAELVAKKNLSDNVVFHPGVPKASAPHVFSRFTLFVNTARSGMFDKTLFEAAACGCDVVAASRDFAERAGEQHAFPEGDVVALAERIREHLSLPTEPGLRRIAEKEGLPVLMERLTAAMVE